MANKYLNDTGLQYFFNKLKTLFLTNVAYDSTNKKLTKTINGTTSDIVTVATLKTAFNLSNVGFGQGAATVNNTAGTTAIAVSLSNYVLSTGGVVAIRFLNAVPANATLNINSKGAKSIYYGGSAITADVIVGGDTATFMYDGTNYNLIALDRSAGFSYNSSGSNPYVVLTQGSDSYNVYETTTVDGLLGAVASIPIGGRNLMLNTYEPSLRNDFRPMILGQTTLSGINTNNVITLVEHGVRITATDAHYPIIRFGSSTVATGDMNGLKAGHTYTFSADCKWKVLSNDATTTKRYMRCYANVVRQGGSEFELLTSANDGNVKRRGTTEIAIQKGVEQSGRMDTTFTIPDDAVAFYMRITSSDINNNLHSAGDFLELANIKFEEGARCTNYSPAPEDIIRKTELNLRYSGVNLLHGTNDISDSSKWVLSRAATSSNNSVILTPTTNSSYAKYKTDYLTYGQLKGQTVTLSFDMKVISGGTYSDLSFVGAYLTLQKPTRINEDVSPTFDRYSLKYSYQNIENHDEWNRYTISWEVNESTLSAGVSDATDLFVDSSFVSIRLYRYLQTAPAEFRNIKLELGGVGTGWSLSPSDTSTPSSLSVQIPFCQYTGSASSLNLSSGTITQIPLDTSIFANTSDFTLENNGVKVLKAGTYKITGAVYISPGSSATGYGAYIRKGTGAFSDATEIMSCLYAKPTDRGHNGAIICGPKYVSLNANDIVYLAARSTGADGACNPSHGMTYLLIENSKLSTIPVPTITQDSTTNGLTII